LAAGLTSAPAARAVGRHHHVARQPVGVAGLLGHDVSWPQCPHGMPLPRPGAFLIIGLTNGTALRRNPCLRGQLAWGRRSGRPLAAYAVVNPPTRAELRRDQADPQHRCRGAGPSRLTCAFGNAGVSEALFTLRTLAATGWQTGLLWVDVELRTAQPWLTRLRSANRALLAAFDATVRAAGVEVGYYSTAYQWRVITGGWRPPAGSPEWYAIGTGGVGALRAACRHSFAGGPTVMTQAVWGRHDVDLVCPGSRSVVAAMSLYHASPPAPHADRVVLAR
jgi:hypothetical protein